MSKLTLANLPPEEKILSELVKFRRTGVFTLTLTELLETKRQEYGLSIRDTVVLLCITPQTYYNWWNGLTRRCNMMHRDRIIRFISGQLDYLMRSQQSRPSKTDLKNIDWQFAHVYKFRHQTRQLIKLFHFSLTSPELSSQLLGKLETLCKNSLRQMNAFQSPKRQLPLNTENPALPSARL